MSELETPAAGENERAHVATAFVGADLACAFGPSFFLGHLGHFVRDRCPDPKENLPVVHAYLADGETSMSATSSASRRAG
jgi:hypothetical protein